MQNPSSIKILISTARLKDEEQTICELHILCQALGSSGRLKTAVAKGVEAKKRVNDLRILKKVLESL